MRTRKLLVAGLLILAALPVRAITLTELLQLASDTPTVNALNARIQQQGAETRELAGSGGWRAIAGADAGYFNELDGPRGLDKYTGYGGYIGLSHPLFGSHRNNSEAEAFSELTSVQLEHERTLLGHEHRRQIRTSYYDWWYWTALATTCQDLSRQSRAITNTIDERYRAGDLRESQRQLLQNRWTGLERHCTRAGRTQHQVRQRLARLAGLNTRDVDRAEPPALPELADPVDWGSLLESHPAMSRARAEVSLTRDTADSSWYDDLEAGFEVTNHFNRRDDNSDTGYSLVAGIRLEMPLTSFSGSTRGDARKHRYYSAQEQLQATRYQLLDNVEHEVMTYQELRDEIDYRQDRRSQHLREYRETLARQPITGDRTFFGIESARLDLIESYFELYDRWRALAAQSATMVAIQEDTGAPWDSVFTAKAITIPTPLTATAPPTAWQQRVYLWNSRELLAPASRARVLDQLVALGFNHVYLGLDAAQVNAAETSSRLRQLLSEAHRSNLRVSLLLGDPDWISEQGRPRLVDLVRRFDSLPFDGLHLDLEVEQLGWPVPQQRLEAWLATLQAVSESTDLPLSIASHYRWFEPQTDGTTCIPCRLPALGIKQVSLMIYTTNLTRRAQLVQSITTAWPDMQFSLAQSAEPTLSPVESWQGRSARELSALSRQWQGELQQQGLWALEWQDWSSITTTDPMGVTE
ncbi:TolC family protein [Marinobacter zhejiangensis]|uniref:Outer membrane protein TolC n=1 Tax=Marinobacter zhejiangensis TaxID=488535 RepID=A0A1I4M8T3_9GAMM|nr:TolC family protein [Marinobacter zhejiangensis]SFL99682.1 Outer membrane protein TolC [Marinobacter zhejiangensis]